MIKQSFIHGYEYSAVLVCCRRPWMFTGELPSDTTLFFLVVFFGVGAPWGEEVRS